MPYSTLFFDLDGTLYENSSGVWELIGERIDQYMIKQVGIPKKDVAPLRQEYLESYGTTLRGLHIHHDVNPDDYLEYVHDIPLEEHLHPNGKLETLLDQLPQHKWIFTNASQEHAQRVLAALNLNSHFLGILDVKRMGYRGKPDTGVYTLALDLAGEPRPDQTVFIDDRAENLVPAKELGAHTVLVGTREPHPAADLSIPLVQDLLQAIPALVE